MIRIHQFNLTRQIIYTLGKRGIDNFGGVLSIGHTFDLIHPFTGITNKFNILEKSNAFFNKQLYKGIK
jgi:hypothetical protein